MRVDLSDIPDWVTLALIVAGAGIAFSEPMTLWGAFAVTACLFALGWIGNRANRKLRQIEAYERERLQNETREFQETLIPGIIEALRREGFSTEQQEKVREIIGAMRLPALQMKGTGTVR